ncbi:hypothetical protein EJB05_42048, partial [Eragrostis curvula]
MKMGRNDPSTPSIHAELGRVLDPVEQNRLARETRREGEARAAAATEARGGGGGGSARRRRDGLTHPPRRRRHPPPGARRLLAASPRVCGVVIGIPLSLVGSHGCSMFARGSPKLSTRLLAVANGTKKKCSPKCSGAAKTSPRSHLAEGTYNVTSLDLAKRDIPDLEDETLRQIEDREGFVDLIEEAEENDNRTSPYWYAVRPPHIRGLGVGTLRSLTLKGLTVLRQDFLNTDLPSLEDLHIGECTIAASIRVTSDAMPRLRHLDITDVAVMANDTKAGIDVLADELRTLRVSCYWGSSTEPPPTSDEFEMFRLPARFRASFTAYSSFRLRAPKLRVFDWRCCYADEVRVESVGRLSDVVVELAAGRKPRTTDEELSYVTVEQRDKLMTDILRGLMPGLQPLTGRNVKRKCVRRDDRWVCFEITNAMRILS